MADYYPILSRAVSNLPHNTAWARKDLYDRARSIMMEQLRTVGIEDTSPGSLDQQEVFDSAVRRIEAEIRTHRVSAAEEWPLLPEVESPAAAQSQASKTAKHLSRILDALQSDETAGESRNAAGNAAFNGATARRAGAGVHVRQNRKTAVAEDPSQLLPALGKLLFRIAYGVMAVTSTAVVYIRGAVWVAEGFIGYPILFAMTAIAVGVFVVPPLTFFRGVSA
jgi:hypothetical protein